YPGVSAGGVRALRGGGVATRTGGQRGAGLGDAGPGLGLGSLQIPRDARALRGVGIRWEAACEVGRRRLALRAEALRDALRLGPDELPEGLVGGVLTLQHVFGYLGVHRYRGEAQARGGEHYNTEPSQHERSPLLVCLVLFVFGVSGHAARAGASSPPFRPTPVAYTRPLFEVNNKT